MNKTPNITDIEITEFRKTSVIYSYLLRVKSPTPLAKIGKTSVHKSADKNGLKQMGFYYFSRQDHTLPQKLTNPDHFQFQFCT